MGVKRRRSWFVAGLLLFCATSASALLARAARAEPQRILYAVDQASENKGSISLYDIDAGHRLIRIVQTVPGIHDVRGVAASAATGRLFVAYETASRIGHVFCLNIHDDKILWDRVIAPGVDRLAASPDGRLLYVPTWEENSANFINIVDASSGAVLRTVAFSSHSHDTQYPLSGPLFQETKADDGSGNYLYLIQPHTDEVSKIGPFAAILGPFAVNGSGAYAVADVMHLWGMQVADLKTHEIITAAMPDHPSGDPWLLHGIGWTPDETEVWQSGPDGQVTIWDMRNPRSPALKKVLSLRNGPSHWLTFTIKGDYAYVAPEKNSTKETEIFDTRSYASVGSIKSSEDMLEIDFTDGKISEVGDQFGIGRKRDGTDH